MFNKVVVYLAWLSLVAGLILPTTFPEVANVVVLALMGMGLLVLIFDPHSRRVMSQPAVWLPLLAGMALSLALLFTAKSPMHVVAVMILAPLFLIGPLAALFGKLPVPLTPALIGTFALIGAGGAAAIGLYDVFVRGLSRGGDLVNNVIHFADIALAIGFLALVGILHSLRKLRLIFILGPILALVAAVMANSRGPLLASVPLAVAAVAVISAKILPRRWIVPAVLATLACVVGGGYAAYAFGFAGRLERLGSVFALFSTGSTSDNSVGERYYMYVSAWNAFWASPIFGHGLIGYTASAAQYAPPGPLLFKPSQHLHNDIADFAVIGGGLGLLSYGLLLAAPLVGALSVKGKWRDAAIYIGIIMPMGYFSMGLTNAMFGILTQTVVYAVALALIAALSGAALQPNAEETLSSA